MRTSVEETINNLLDEEAAHLLKAGRHERTEEREGYRAGHYERNLTTTSGEIKVKMPKLKGVAFETAIIERYRRRESSVEEAIVEMYLAGVSVRRVEDITEALIYKILSLQEYCGDVINFKTYSKSYKNKRRIVNEDENRAIFWGVHEPIIDRGSWEKVQQMRGTRKKKPKKEPERSLFFGMLKCADCGGNLDFHFNQGNHDIKYFNCQNYNNKRGYCNATHYIRLDFLEQVVIQEIGRLTEFVSRYEDDFMKAMIGHTMQAAETDRARKKRELDKLAARDKELDNLFVRIYEDNEAGKLSDERFAKMSKNYEQEQGELGKRIKVLRSELKKEASQLYTADMFLEIVRRYTNATELTSHMLAELIDHIDVYHAERIDGEVTQRVVVYYHCIGAFEVPDWKNIPEIDILIETRKGVALSYTPEKIAV